MLRHSQITMTMQVYSEVPSDATKDALRGCERASMASCCTYCCTKINHGPLHDRNWPVTWVEPRGFEP